MSGFFLPARALSALALCLLAACSSSNSTTSSHKPMSNSMAARVMSMDPNKRSSFESSLVRSNSGMGKHLQKRGFGTKDYAGNTRYQVPKTLKQESFSGADDRSRMARQAFNRAKEQNHYASETFATPAAREGKRSARQQNQVFYAADDTFKTSAVRDAARSQAENKRPLIVKPDGGVSDETPYTENEIRRLVNRR